MGRGDTDLFCIGVTISYAKMCRANKKKKYSCVIYVMTGFWEASRDMLQSTPSKYDSYLSTQDNLFKKVRHQDVGISHFLTLGGK